MSFDDKINAYFVRTGSSINNEVKEEQMSKALALLGNQISTDRIREIRASEGFPLIASGKLTKKDVFIFDCFEGDFFEQLQLTKSLIIGPPCLTSCLLSCQPIPLGTSPVYTAAMRDLQISATGITSQEKEKLKSLIQWMGGHYFNNFGRSITHLISNTIKSTKYEHATLNGIPVMHVDWVQRVWEKSCSEANILATDEDFDKYRLPIFFGANITCTGLDTEKRNEVMRLVNENGGTYHRAFRSQFVDIVVTEKSKTNSDKYQAAVRFKKDILIPEWIFDSVQKGFALPTKAYQVKPIKASTPTKSDQSVADFTAADSTQLSDISRISVAGKRPDMSTVNETMCSTMNETIQKKNTFLAPAPPGSAVVGSCSSKDLKKEVLKKAGAGTHYRLILEEICPRKAKKAGTFLDGCCLYLSGFRPEEKEKLNKIVNAGGATRYDAVNEEITHIIVGQLDDSEFRSWKNNDILSGVHIVRLDWLLESINLKQPASEAVYRVSLPNMKEPECPSPSSKKTLMSMNHSFKQPEKPIKKKLFDGGSPMDLDTPTQPSPLASSTELPLEDDEHHLLAQYSQENTPKESVPLPPSSENKTQNDITVSNPVASSTHCNMDSIMPPPPSSAPVPSSSKSQQNPIQPNPSDLTDSAMHTLDYENLDCFKGVSLYIDKDHFAEEFYTQIISECEAARGNVVSSNFRDPVDYAIVSFESTFDEETLPVKARYIVTELYVESCLKENTLVPIEYYHKHIPPTADKMPLKGMTVVTSIYATLERDFIESISQLLGAKVNKSFVKKEKPLLVCPSAEGSKYEGALKWRYPVVTSQWLVKCADEGRKLPYAEFLVGQSPSDFPNSSTNNIEENHPPPSAPPAAPLNSSKLPSAPNTPTLVANVGSTDFTPLRNKRVSELAGPLRSSRNSLTHSDPQTPESPHTPSNNYAKASYNFDFMEKILSDIDDEDQRECLRELIEEMRNNQTPELERIRRQACTPINRKIPTPKGIPDFCTTPEFEQRMADEFERRLRLPIKKLKPDTPIEEIRKRVIRAVGKALGIENDDSDEREQSEELPKPSKSEKPKDLLSMKKQQTKSHLSPATVSSAKRFASCGADGSVVKTLVAGAQEDSTPLQHKISRSTSIAPRNIFPHNSPNSSSGIGNITDGFVPNTQSPNQHIQQNRTNDSPEITSLGGRASLDKNSTINFDKISFEETEVGVGGAGGVSSTRLSNANASPSTSASTSASSTLTKTKQRPSAGITASPEVKQITEYLKNCENRRQSMKRNNAQQQQQTQALAPIEITNSEAVHYVQPFESEQFSYGTEEMVGWRDPAEFSVERRSKSCSSMKHQGQPRFSISCSDEAARQSVIEKILQLGGQVCENLVNFDPECTHFVCERPNRGEKMLGCISSGKWVLSLKYIEESFAKDVFIDEELYEWGNCKALNLPQLTADEQTIAQAAHRWRVDLQQAPTSTKGAFVGFRAILRVAERSLDALKNVLKAGNAEIIEIRSPYSSNEIEVENATHCFVDMKKAPLTKDDYKFLIDHNVQVYTQMYINAYLMVGHEVDAEKYSIRL